MHPRDEPLRIAFLAYRGKPHVGGQGVYTRHLTKALVDLGHHVEVLGGQPFPILDERVPLLGTIHHPITVDRRLELSHARSRYHQITLRRWYAFTKMQTRVARRLERIVTVSESSRTDIVKDHGVEARRLNIVPVGVDPE